MVHWCAGSLLERPGPDLCSGDTSQQPLPMVVLMSNPWDWPVTSFDTQHADRVALMREIPFESTQMVEPEEPPTEMPPTMHPARRGKALSLNMSPGGMLLLMDWTPDQEQVLRLQVPAGVQHLRTPTLAEVRWTREVPFPGAHNLCFVGIKFLV